MELGPRDKVSQAFWHEWRAGRTISTHRGDVVYLDLRHLGAEKLHERLPFICELAKAYVGVDSNRPNSCSPNRSLHHGWYRNGSTHRNTHQRPICCR
ncbi:FAD-binding protein [Providencia rettgeri]|nr:FAD-binding protein [Providencia rettgeri]